MFNLPSNTLFIVYPTLLKIVSLRDFLILSLLGPFKRPPTLQRRPETILVLNLSLRPSLKVRPLVRLVSISSFLPVEILRRLFYRIKEFNLFMFLHLKLFIQPWSITFWNLQSVS